MYDFKNPLEERYEKHEKRLGDHDNQLATFETAFQIIVDRLPFLDYYSQIEAAFYLGISEAELAEIAGKNMIKTCHPFDGRHWFLREDMNAFLRDSKNGMSAFIANKEKKKTKKEKK